MKADELEALGSRLDAMSREHALTRWIGAGLFAALAAYLGWSGLPSRPLVGTERLELRDRQGRLRAALALDRDDGMPGLVLLDAEGRERASLIAFPWASALSLSEPDGARVDLMSSALGIPTLGLRAPGGRGGVALVADQDGSLALTVESEGRLARWNIRPDEQGRPVLAGRAPAEGPEPESHPPSHVEIGKPRPAPGWDSIEGGRP